MITAESVLDFAAVFWARVDKAVGPDNKPRLLIHERCKNVIWALENWTGLDGQHGARKDFIDLLRYMALNPPVYLLPEAMECRGGGAY
jgi:hypothetical protein